MDRLQSKGNVICEAPQHVLAMPWDRIIPEGQWFYLSEDGEKTCCEKCWDEDVAEEEPTTCSDCGADLMDGHGPHFCPAGSEDYDNGRP